MVGVCGYSSSFDVEFGLNSYVMIMIKANEFSASVRADE